MAIPSNSGPSRNKEEAMRKLYGILQAASKRRGI
jgi:hypothetical protein